MTFRRGDLHRVDMGPIGHKLALVISADDVHGLLRQPVICMVTSKDRHRALDTYVVVDPPEGGLTSRSFVLCHNVLTVEDWRLSIQPLGGLSTSTMAAVASRLARTLGLS